jgi:leucyl aminopeptidase
LPIASNVTLLPVAGPHPAGDYLRAMAGGAGAPADLVALAVEAGGEMAADAGLDAILPASAAEVIAAYQLTGKAGEVAETMARVGTAAVRVMFLGVGDRSPRALRRAGAELGRRVADGLAAAAAVVAGQGDEQVQAFAEGILLGSYTFSLKSGASDPAGAPGLVRLLVAGPGGGGGEEG